MAEHLRNVSFQLVEGIPATASSAPSASHPVPKGVCPHFHAAIELIGKRWSGAILCALEDGPLRFGEICRAVPGLSDRLLSQRLRELEEAGIVRRSVADGAPVKVSYELTEKGRDLGPSLDELRGWAKRWR